jgi:hypothetical protein
MHEVDHFTVESRVNGNHYVARILIRDPAAYNEQCASEEGRATLEAQRANLDAVMKDPKAIKLQRIRQAEKQAKQLAKQAAASGLRKSARLLAQKIVQLQQQ